MKKMYSHKVMSRYIVIRVSERVHMDTGYQKTRYTQIG